MAADDTLSVLATDFVGNLTPGNYITPEQILVGKGLISATSVNQRFIYNTTTGALFFDADGNQTGVAAIQVAVLNNKPYLSRSDVFVTG